MDVLVTGATGFVGANVARRLVAEGYRVRVLARPSSSLKALDGCPVDVVRGDIVDLASMRGAVEGCAQVFHAAADYRLWAKDPAEIYRSNVDSTRTVLEACTRARVERVVYTSSVGTVGLPRDGGVGTETTPVGLEDMVGHYKRSKFLAERVADEYAARGLPVVIVNPTNPIGAWEVRPTPTGQLVLDYLLRRMVATLDTGLNLIHVADVARGHVLAAQRGRVGDKYILGCRNCSLTDIFGMLESITGIRAPRVRVPHALIYLVALANEGVARATGRPPRVPLTGVRMARKHMYFSAEKAVRELGLPQTPVEQALHEAIEWFVVHGGAPPPPASPAASRVTPRLSVAAFKAAAGPRGYPLVGVFPRARRDPLGFFTECARRYGDVSAMRLGTHDVYLLSHPEHVWHVLHERGRVYAKGPAAARIRGLFGDSLTMVDDDRWRRRRRQLQPAFQSSQHAQLASIIGRATAEMLERWRRSAAGDDTVDAVSEMRRLTQTIIVRACFGEMAAADIEALAQALDVAVGYVERRLWSPLGWLDVPTPGGARYRRALATIDACIARTIGNARRSTPLPGSMLAALVASPAGGEPVTDAELHTELKAMLVAGYTTTASALAWTWYLLSAHADVRVRLEDECRTLLSGRAPSSEALPRLSYTRRVIDEVLRLYPPTWVTARLAVEDDVVAGYTIPAGAIVLLSPYVTHRHPAAWEAPDVFDPERFTPARAAARPSGAYVPFGDGARRCIGSAFALTEMQLIIAAVAQRYRLTLVPGAPVLPLAGLTLRPSPAVPCRLSAARSR